MGGDDEETWKRMLKWKMLRLKLHCVSPPARSQDPGMLRVRRGSVSLRPDGGDRLISIDYAVNTQGSIIVFVPCPPQSPLCFMSFPSPCLSGVKTSFTSSVSCLIVTQLSHGSLGGPPV